MGKSKEKSAASGRSEPIQILNLPVQHYEWGSHGSDSLIPNLLNLAAAPEKPYAELWMGAHEKSPATLRDSGKSLKQFIDENPRDTLGERVLAGHGPSLPFLAKILSVRNCLSIQVHPDKNMADLLHLQDPDHYPDDRHKPEMAIALDNFHALAGFRPDDEIRELLNTLRLSAESAAKAFMESLLKEFEQGGLESVLRQVLEAAQSESTFKGILREVRAQLMPLRSDDPRFALFADLFHDYDRDPGLFVLLLLQYHQLERGEALYLSPGIPHAYISGNLIECMANSDNVIRLGLTKKFRDPGNLLRALNYEAALTSPEQIKSDERLIYRTADREFLLEWVAGEQDRILDRGGNPAIVFCMKGDTHIRETGSATDVLLRMGEAAFIPVQAGECRISMKDDCDVLCFRSDY